MADRLGKALAPRPGKPEFASQIEAEVGMREFAVADQDRLKQFSRRALTHDGIERARELGQPRSIQGQPGRHRMAAKAQDQAGIAHIDFGQHVAHMDASDP